MKMRNTSILFYVLLLSGIEIIFFVVASKGLFFRFVLKTGLLIQGCFHYC